MFSILLVLLFLPGFQFVSAARTEGQGQTYSALVTASDIEAGIVGVPIYLDGQDSGFVTPHEFISLTGFHNFSVPNEHATEHFIGGPPDFQRNPANEGFSLSSEGVDWIIIGPDNSLSSEAAIEFRYGSVPFVEAFRGTFEPGATAKLGLEVHMDPNRVAQGHLEVYDHDWPIGPLAAPFFSSDFTIQGIEPTVVQFGIPTNAGTGSWAYRITIEGTNLTYSTNASFDVAFPPSPASVSFPSLEAMPYSTFDVEGTRYALFGAPKASTIVLYIGGGVIGDISGPTPISGYSNVTGTETASYRLMHDLMTSGFSVVTPLGPWQGLNFPSQLVDYLRNQGKNKFYAIGHSAGGVVVANSILAHPYMFSKAVIADAPLTLESTGFYFTDLSIRSETVTIPHLLIWGRGDGQASLENAYAWMDHVNQSLATLKIYDYNHDWAGTTAESQVRNQILDFLMEKPLVSAMGAILPSNLVSRSPFDFPSDSATVTSSVLSNALIGASYVSLPLSLAISRIVKSSPKRWGRFWKLIVFALLGSLGVLITGRSAASAIIVGL